MGGEENEIGVGDFRGLGLTGRIRIIVKEKGWN